MTDWYSRLTDEDKSEVHWAHQSLTCSLVSLAIMGFWTIISVIDQSIWFSLFCGVVDCAGIVGAIWSFVRLRKLQSKQPVDTFQDRR